MHKAGFVNIIGNPNAGKSTLMNALIGERLSIITPKAQTTRHRIIGIVNEPDYQIVFSDTPGIVAPQYKLHEAMMECVKTALQDADVILYLVDASEPCDTHDSNMLEEIRNHTAPILLLINKIDLISQPVLETTIDSWQHALPNAQIIPVSALHSFNIKGIIDSIIPLLPEHEPYYAKDELTDRSERFFVAELIRQYVFELYHKEIPYSVQVVIDAFKETPTIDKIYATIFVMKESQKPIILGKMGAAIKNLGIKSRIAIEKFLDKKVHLELQVKVKKDWRSNPQSLKSFGYIQK